MTVPCYGEGIVTCCGDAEVSKLIKKRRIISTLKTEALRVLSTDMEQDFEAFTVEGDLRTGPSVSILSIRVSSQVCVRVSVCLCVCACVRACMCGLYMILSILVWTNKTELDLKSIVVSHK